jgi:hypothetical protein
MAAPPLDALPGFRRRFRIVPALGRVSSEVEDDYHHMGVVLHHAGGVAVKVEAVMVRAPWTTCPGAVAQLASTFTGVRLDGFPARGEKSSNCAHLHDLATLAAAHAGDAAPLIYDVLTSDPVNGSSRTELRRNGELVLSWALKGFEIAAPAALAGTRLDKLKPASVADDALGQEAVRVLRWGSIISHGRAIPLEHQSDASRFPGNCYTFQPERIPHAHRVGVIKDFSKGRENPLDQPAAPAA